MSSLNKIPQNNGNHEANTMKLVSVILPFYNAEKYLSSALDSIFLQSYQNLEIILVNDGSTDGSCNVAFEAVNKDTRVRYIELAGPHGHVAAGRNAGIKIASGEYITFQDADDISDQSRIEKQVAFLEKNSEAELVSCLSTDFSDDGSIERADGGAEFLTSSQIAKNLYRCNSIIQACALFRYEVFTRYGLYDEETPYAKDYEYWLRMLRMGAVFHKLPEILYRRRIHSQQWMSVNAGSLVQNSMRLKIESALLPHRKNDSRELVIWGWGTAGKAFYEVAKEYELPVRHILDGVPDVWGTRVGDLTVVSPHNILNWGGRYLYILCTYPGLAMAREIMEEVKLEHHKDYFEFA